MHAVWNLGYSQDECEQSFGPGMYNIEPGPLPDSSPDDEVVDQFPDADGFWNETAQVQTVALNELGQHGAVHHTVPVGGGLSRAAKKCVSGALQSTDDLLRKMASHDDLHSQSSDQTSKLKR